VTGQVNVDDLMNNEIGIELGRRFPKISLESIIEQAKKLILEGKAWVIKKDEEGNFLDLHGNIISKEQWLGKWNTPKVIINSNYRNSGNNHNNKHLRRHKRFH
jgi:hypothetical protein